MEKAGSTEADKVREAIVGLGAQSFTSTKAEMLKNHHITKPLLGEPWILDTEVTVKPIYGH